MQLLDAARTTRTSGSRRTSALFVEETLPCRSAFFRSRHAAFVHRDPLGALGALEIAGIEIPGYMFWVALIYAIVARG
jgi:hypothetical protein